MALSVFCYPWNHSLGRIKISLRFSWLIWVFACLNLTRYNSHEKDVNFPELDLKSNSLRIWFPDFWSMIPDSCFLIFWSLMSPSDFLFLIFNSWFLIFHSWFLDFWFLISWFLDFWSSDFWFLIVDFRWIRLWWCIGHIVNVYWTQQ